MAYMSVSFVRTTEVQRGVLLATHTLSSLFLSEPVENTPLVPFRVVQQCAAQSAFVLSCQLPVHHTQVQWRYLHFSQQQRRLSLRQEKSSARVPEDVVNNICWSKWLTCPLHIPGKE